MTLPEIRKELTAILGRLTVLVREMKRRPPIRRSPRESRPMTPQLKAKARAMFRRGMSQQSIAKKLGVNHGRVSEAVRGYRK